MRAIFLSITHVPISPNPNKYPTIILARAIERNRLSYSSNNFNRVCIHLANTAASCRSPCWFCTDRFLSLWLILDGCCCSRRRIIGGCARGTLLILDFCASTNVCCRSRGRILNDSSWGWRRVVDFCRRWNRLHSFSRSQNYWVFVFCCYGRVCNTFAPGGNSHRRWCVFCAFPSLITICMCV